MKKRNFIHSRNIWYAIIMVCVTCLISCEDEEIMPLATSETNQTINDIDSRKNNEESSADSTVNHSVTTSSFTVKDWGTVGEEIRFTDNSTAEDGEIVSWEWNFGDSHTSTTSSPVKIYAEAGDYTIILTVTDNSGQTDTSSASISIANAFEVDSASTGTNPRGNLIESNGQLWGMTQSGGIDNHGVIFTLNTDGTGFHEVFRFNGINGSSPFGSLLEHGGKFWGMTNTGGTFDMGVLFSINNDGTGFRKVYDFDGRDGSNPIGNLIESDGKLWGMTSEGGNSRGVIFSIDVDGTNFKKVHDFVSGTGHVPYGSLVEAYGRLWGTTQYGGDFDWGTIFSINTDGTGFKSHHHCKDLVGGRPGNLTPYNNRLWGTANDMIFSLNTNGDQFRVEYSGFLRSRGSLIVYENKLWGMTQTGGAHSDGDVFSISPGGTFEVIHEFDELVDQSNEPYGDLLVVDDKLWGMLCGASNWSTYYPGAIFSIDPDGSDYQIEHSF